MSCRGSQWRRWDPHLHAPGTLLSNNFGRTWDGYLEAIETADPPVSVLGVTDYFCIRTYKRACELKAQGRMSDVDLLFPNVELRLDLKTERVRSINIHLLFSPDDPSHVDEIERALARLTCEFNGRPWRCTPEDLIRVGRMINPKAVDDEVALSAGVNQFKVTISDIRNLFRQDEWVRKNCLIAVAGGLHDGTSGLQRDDSYALTRREIESCADIIFSATPSAREFWLGKKPGYGPDFIERTYRFLKPCLHGSDAHVEESVAVPDLQRYCWIKGDPTFEALRQAILEPEERVWIGPTPPPHHVPQMAVDTLRVTDAPWLATSGVELNPGLVAVIGARGSGKTALVEILARGAQAPSAGYGESSFLRRAHEPTNLLREATVELLWRDGSTTSETLAPADSSDREPIDAGDVCYLSQQFVDRLCSSAGLAKELRAEMERVIFEATDPTERLDTSSFNELADVLLDPIRRRRTDLREEIHSITRRIVAEDDLRAKHSQLTKERDATLKKIEQAKKDLAALLPKGKEERSKRLGNLEQAHAKMQSKIEGQKRRRQALVELAGEVQEIRLRSEPRRLAEMRRRYVAAELPDASWTAFGLDFVGDVEKVLEAAKGEVEKEIRIATEGEPDNPVDPSKAPLETWPLDLLRERRDALRKEVGIDAERQKKYDELRRSIEQMEGALRRLGTEIERAQGAEGRRQELVQARRETYAQVFGTFREEEETLAGLYEPLSRELRSAQGALGRLEFFVHRRVDLDAWVSVGERDLLDLRLAGRFRGHGALRKEAEARLLPALTRGAADEVAATMDGFLREFQRDLLEAMPRSVPTSDRAQWVQSMAAWLFSSDHIHIEYGIRYDGTAIEQLSPGTRGIVLLLLYLAIDRQDRRPLVIDQPEENLDPKSVFEELVPHFREARQRRQIIIVTHNANLVVNTDSDQVIVASATATERDSLPTISYESGALENPRIRKAVCETLEGGERAFLERERRYRLHWGEAPHPEQHDASGSS